MLIYKSKILPTIFTNPINLIFRIYNAGAQPKMSNLYHPVTFPVSRGTPMLASMIEWDHSTEWAVAHFGGKGARSGESVIEVDLSTESDKYLEGHTIDGRILFPATGYMTLAWKTFAKLKNADFEKLPVVFENIQFHRATIMPKDGVVKFYINIMEGSGNFEIVEGGSIAASGRIYEPEDIKKEMLDIPKPFEIQEDLLPLSENDIYKDLRLRGYDYSGMFRGLHEAENRGNTGTLKWENNWISYMDTMLQFSILGQSLRELYLPTRLQRAIINPVMHLQELSDKKRKYYIWFEVILQ